MAVRTGTPAWARTDSATPTLAAARATDAGSAPPPRRMTCVEVEEWWSEYLDVLSLAVFPIAYAVMTMYLFRHGM